MGVKKKISAIDDDESVIAMYQDILNIEFDLFMTTSPSELMANLKEFNPDLMIVDLVIPEKSGIEIIKEIRELCAPKIVVISGTSNSDLFNRAQELSEAFISKPFEPYVVYQRIKSLLYQN